PRLAKGDALNLTHWMQFNGTAFILLTTQINFFLILAPAWVAALYLSLALLGLIAWPGETGLRTAGTVFTFIAAFAVLGMKPHNSYWGLMYARLLPLGLVWAPAAGRDLWRAAFARRVTAFGQ